MKRLALPAVLLASLAVPSGALAAGANRGVVLSMDAAHHTVQVVSADHSVHAFRYHGRLRHVSAGSVLTFRRHGSAISAVHVAGRARNVTYTAKVVRSAGNRLVLALADGRRVSFSGRHVRGLRSHHAHSAQVLAHAASITTPGVTINIQGLAPGSTVLVTESIAADGSETITITLPPAAAGSGDTTGDQGDQGDQGDGSTSDETGAITQIGDSSVTIDTQDAGPMTFSVDPGQGLTDGFVTGDVVDVTYEADGSGGNVADDIEYVETDATGTVTSVSDGALTITDDATGQPDSFTADPSQQMFDGVGTGDSVDVTYHVNSGQMIVDSVDDVTVDESGN